MDDLFSVFDEVPRGSVAAGATAPAVSSGSSAGDGAARGGEGAESSEAGAGGGKRARVEGRGEGGARIDSAAGGTAEGGGKGDGDVVEVEEKTDEDEGEQLQPDPTSKEVVFATAEEETTAEGHGGEGGGEGGEAEATEGVEVEQLPDAATDASYDRWPPVPGKAPAKEYSFVLDPFQRRAVNCLERDESVLVSAHTSAGKTAVAEYAIAMALRDKQRVIYTSPIKALSNQKYRDLFEEFGDVGLMTGDVTIAPEASCLVMTTEILRSMLYRGSEVTREVKWVIFDEIHYMRDKERGVVWEEAIILVPHSVRFVFLSATIPNAHQFASWVASLHHQRCHVVHTDYRPTPLQHYLYPAGAKGVFLVVDENGRFHSDSFAKAMAALEDEGEDGKGGGGEGAAGKLGKKRRRSSGGGPGGGGASDLFKLIKMVMERKYNPVIVFSFSKRETEANALQVSRLDLTTDDEKQMISKVFKSAIASLRAEDQRLPQIQSILPLLRRGIGIHHGGLLPILKEVVEILFGESLVKVLFATETFAMGINMPAKTVIFTSSRKFDGVTHRTLSAGEYIQMSGRAGRRGLDDRGIVILMTDSKMEPTDAKQLLRGTADPLNSAFHLGYNMLLNLTRVQDAGADPESMLERSFHQFQARQARPAMEKALKEKTEQLVAVSKDIPDLATLVSFDALLREGRRVRDSMRQLENSPNVCLRFLKPGRIVRIRDQDVDWGWGVVLTAAHRGPVSEHPDQTVPIQSSDSSSSSSASTTTVSSPHRLLVHVLLVVADADESRSGPAPCPLEDRRLGNGEARVVPVLGTLLDGISAVRIKVPSSTETKAARLEARRRLDEVVFRRFPGGGPSLIGIPSKHSSTTTTTTTTTTSSSSPTTESGVDGEGVASRLPEWDGSMLPMLSPEKEMGMSRRPDWMALKRESDVVAARLAQSPLARLSWVEREKKLSALEERAQLERECAFLKTQIRATEALVMRESLKRMRRVLRRLGHLDGDGVVLEKGRVACEVNTADELLVTEMMFDGAFNDLSPSQTAAVLSSLVHTDRGNDDESVHLPKPLQTPAERLKSAALRVAQASKDARIPIEIDEYIKSFRQDMMESVFLWANGAPFAAVCKRTKAFEGSIIRVIRRLEELLRQLADAARSIGNSALEEKFNAASASMRRDIVFAASLYIG